MYFTETHIYIPTAYFTLQKHTFTYMLPSMHSTETNIPRPTAYSTQQKNVFNFPCHPALYINTFFTTSTVHSTDIKTHMPTAILHWTLKHIHKTTPI